MGGCCPHSLPHPTSWVLLQALRGSWSQPHLSGEPRAPLPGLPPAGGGGLAGDVRQSLFPQGGSARRALSPHSGRKRRPGRTNGQQALGRRCVCVPTSADVLGPGRGGLWDTPARHPFPPRPKTVFSLSGLEPRLSGNAPGGMFVCRKVPARSLALSPETFWPLPLATGCSRPSAAAAWRRLPRRSL